MIISDRTTKINIGYLLLQTFQVCDNALTKWNQLETQECTRENFKTHFRNAQKKICRTGALALQDTINHTKILNILNQGLKMALKDKDLATITTKSTNTRNK